MTLIPSSTQLDILHTSSQSSLQQAIFPSDTAPFLSKGEFCSFFEIKILAYLTPWIDINILYDIFGKL